MHYIYENTTIPFQKVKVMDILFRGVELDCSGKRFEEKVI